MQDQSFEGIPIRKLDTRTVIWLLDQLENCDIPYDLQETAEICKERLRIELTARKLGI